MFGLFRNILGKTDPGQLKQLITEGAFLVDVRTRAEFREGHVKSSVNIPLDQLLSTLSQFKGKDAIVVFCRSGVRSSQAKMILESRGFDNVVNGGSWTQIQQLVKDSAHK